MKHITGQGDDIDWNVKAENGTAVVKIKIKGCEFSVTMDPDEWTEMIKLIKTACGYR